MTPLVERSPYCGLLPYKEEDAPFFFGRTAEIALVISNMLASRLTLLYGASGVGKSSVLSAGVLPELQRLAERNLEQVGKAELAVVVLRDWTHAPTVRLIRLVRDACKLAVPANGGAVEDRQGELLAVLREGSERVGGEILVILDQFEEHFLYDVSDDDESFDDAFVAAINDSELRVNFLISIREDAVAKLDQFKGRIPRLFDNYLRIEHLDTSAAKEAIEKPVEQYNALFGKGERTVTLGPGLVEAVLAQVRAGQLSISEAAVGGIGAASTDLHIETPFLQLVMTRLWDTEMAQKSTVIRRATFCDTLGGAHRIVQTHVRTALQTLTAEETTLAVAALRYLITPSRTKIALPAADLAAMADLPPEPVARLLEKLTGSDYRLLKPVPPPPDRAGAVNYEIAHDVLAQAILDWRAEQVRLADVKAVRERTSADLAIARRRAEEQEAIARRNRKMTIAVSLLLLVTLVSAGLGAYQYRIAVAHRDEARRQESVANENAASAEAQARNAQWRKQLVDSRIVLDTDPVLALLLARHTLRETMSAGSDIATSASEALATALSVSRVLRQFEIGVVRKGTAKISKGNDDKVAALGSKGEIYLLENLDLASRGLAISSEDVVDMRLAPGGQRVALSLVGGDLEIREWTGAKRTISLDAPAVAMAWSPDESTIALADASGRVTFQRVTSDKSHAIRAFESGSGQWIEALEFSPDGRWLAGVGTDRVVRVWSVRDRKVIYSFCGHRDDVTAVRFSPDGRSLATASNDSTALLWALDQRSRAQACGRIKPQMRLVGHVNSVFDLRFNPDSNILATASADSTVRLWDVASGRPLLVLAGHRGPVEQIEYLANGERIASAGWDGTVRIWDVTGHADVLQAIDLSHGNERFATLSQSGHAAVRESMTGEVYRQQQFKTATSIAVDRIGQRVAVGHTDGSIETHLFSSGKGIIWKGHGDSVTQIAVSADGRWIASGGADGYARLWNSATGTKQREVDHGYRMSIVSFSPDGQFLLSGDESGSARLWSLSNGTVELSDKHEQQLSSVAWSNDGRWVASSSQDKTLRLWSLPTGEFQRSLQFSALVFGVAFSPDSQRIIAVSGDDAYQYAVSTGEKLPKLAGHNNLVMGAQYSPDGTRIATASWDRTVRIWDARTGQQLTSYMHEHFVRDAVFTRDGQALVTISEAAKARYIPLSHTELLRLADDRVTRKLKDYECEHYLNTKPCPVQ